MATLKRFELERSEETLRHRVVIAVARPTRAADHFALISLGIERVGERAAPVMRKLLHLVDGILKSGSPLTLFIWNIGALPLDS